MFRLDFNSFTPTATRAVVLAFDEAERVNSGLVRPDLLLVGILLSEESAANRILRDGGLSLAAVREQVGKPVATALDSTRTVAKYRQVILKVPRITRQLIRNATREARKLGHSAVGTEHLLLAILNGKGELGALFERLQFDRRRAFEQVMLSLSET